MFIHAARAVMSRPYKTGKVYGEWLMNLRATKPFNVVTVALANKLARIAWVVMKTRQAFNSNGFAMIKVMTKTVEPLDKNLTQKTAYRSFGLF